MKAIQFFFLVLFTGVACNLHAQETLFVGSGSNFTIQPGANMYVAGGMQLDNKTSLTNNGNIFLAGTKNRESDLKDNSTTAYHYGAGTFTFSGTGSQFVKSINQFGKIEVENEGLSLLSNVTTDNWYLKNGKINTGAFYAIAASPKADAIMADAGNQQYAGSWFNGNLRRYISPGSANNYLFPVGDAGKAYPCELTDLNSKFKSTHYIDAAFSAGVSNGIITGQAENGKTYTTMINKGIWRLAPDVEPGYGTYDLKLFFNDLPGVSDNSFAILNQTNNTGWTLPAGSLLPAEGMPGRTVAGGFAGRNNINLFGQFAIANSAAGSGQSSSLTVYPDPVTNNEFFIRVGNNKINEIKLFASNGKEVNVNGTSYQKIDVLRVELPSTLAKGVYTIRMSTDNGLRTSSIVVQ